MISAGTRSRGIGAASVWIGLGEALALPTGLVTTAFLTRTLGPQSYGLLTLAAGIITWLQFSVAAMYSRLIVNAIGSTDDPRAVVGPLMKIVLSTSTVVALGVFVTANVVASALHEPALAGYLRLYSVDIVVFATALAYRNVRIGLGHYNRRALSSAVRWIARMVFILVLVGMGYGVTGAIVGSIGASLIDLAINFWAKGGLPFRAGSVSARKLIWSGLPVILSAILMRLFERLDLFALKILGASAAAAGEYGAAQNCLMVTSIVATAVSPPLLSNLSRMLRENDHRGAEREAQHAFHLAISLLPFCMLGSLSARPVARILFGEGFTVAGSVLELLIWFGLTAICLSLGQVILIAFGRTRQMLLITAATLLSCLALLVSLIPRWGLRGAALSMLISGGCGAAATFGFARRVARVAPPANSLLAALVVTVMVLLLSQWWKVPLAFELAKIAVLSAIALLALVLLAQGHQAWQARSRMSK